jgi:hypothetical protein
VQRLAAADSEAAERRALLAASVRPVSPPGPTRMDDEATALFAGRVWMGLDALQCGCAAAAHVQGPVRGCS